MLLYFISNLRTEHYHFTLYKKKQHVILQYNGEFDAIDIFILRTTTRTLIYLIKVEAKAAKPLSGMTCNRRITSQTWDRTPSAAI